MNTDTKEIDINDFLNTFLNNYYEIRSLLINNINVFYEMSKFVINQSSLGEQKEFDWNKITKSTFLQNVDIINKFFQEIGIQFSMDQIIRDGTLEVIPTNYERIMYGLNNYIGDHKEIKVYNNGYITDTIVWVHEISHYRNQPEEGRTEVNDLFTEALAHTTELIYTDYLEKLGFAYEASYSRNSILNTFKRASSGAYIISKIIELYEMMGKVSKETYKEFYGNDEYYDDETKKFIKNASQNPFDIFNALWYTLSGALSIYMYEEYRKNNNYANNLEELNTSLLNGDDINKCLRIIGITGYNEESLDKIKEAYDEFKKDLDVKTKILSKK